MIVIFVTTPTWCCLIRGFEATPTWCCMIDGFDATPTWCCMIVGFDATPIWCCMIDALRTVSACLLFDAAWCCCSAAGVGHVHLHVGPSVAVQAV